jgi:hypothetical protein
MKRTVCLLLLILGMGGASAQSGLGDLAQQGCTYAQDAADLIGIQEGFEWICYASDLIQKVEATLTTFHEELGALGGEVLRPWLQDAFASVADEVGAGELEGVFADLERVLTEGPGAFRQAVEDAVDRVLALRDSKAPPPGSPDARIETAFNHPNLAAGETILRAQEKRALTARAEAAAAHDLNAQLAGEVAASTGAQDAVARILEPSVGGLGGGDAAQLEDAVRTATSTRAALQALTEGVADMMRHEAVLSGTMVEHLRTLSQQQVMTTWELQLAVNTLVEQREAEIAEERAALQAQIDASYEAGEEIGQAISSLAGAAATTMTPDTESLSLGALGF